MNAMRVGNGRLPSFNVAKEEIVRSGELAHFSEWVLSGIDIVALFRRQLRPNLGELGMPRRMNPRCRSVRGHLSYGK